MKDLPEYLKKQPKCFGKKKQKVRGSMAPESRTRRMPKHDRESTVQKEVLGRAVVMGIPLYRQQAGNVMIGSSYMKLAPAGAADLTGVIPPYGIRLEVECKRRDGKGKWSDEQQLWNEKCKSCGCVYILVKSGDEFENKVSKILDLLDKHGIVKVGDLSRIVRNIT